ncbi:MAG: hypothetical protein PWQ55_2571 [Chloroflexota bacterium]|nr:hypothetical protein [Chloroflexota bacterium]
MDHKDNLAQWQVKHLIYLGIFTLTLGFRAYAAVHLNITQSEADILLNLTQAGAVDGSRGSLLYQMLTLPLMALFGNGNLVVRFWPLLAGALLTLAPLLFEDWLGEVPALVLAGLLALDPFGTAAALQLSSGMLTLATLIIGAGLLHRRKSLAGLLVLLACLLSGRAVLYPLAVGALLVLVLFLQREMESAKVAFQTVKQAVQDHIRVIAMVLVILVALVFVLGIPLSDMLNDVLSMFDNWNQPYALGSSPQLYPIALASYIPLALVCLFFPSRSDTGRRLFPYILLVSLLALILASLNPGHQVPDLVWASSPLWIAVAFNLGALLDHAGDHPCRVWLYALIIAVLLVSLVLTVVMLIYQMQYGLDLVGNLLAAIALLVMVTMVVLFLAYNDTVPMALTALRWGLLAVVLVGQMAYTSRALGLNGSPSGEILWGGYYEGSDTVVDIIDNSNLESLSSGVDMSVGILQPANSAVEWALARQYPMQELSGVSIDQRLAVLVSGERDALDAGSADGYFGQDFNANSYPLWIWQPGKSLSDMDFWFWLVFRQGQIMRETDYIWVNKILFVNSYWE